MTKTSWALRNSSLKGMTDPPNEVRTFPYGGDGRQKKWMYNEKPASLQWHLRGGDEPQRAAQSLIKIGLLDR